MVGLITPTTQRCRVREGHGGRRRTDLGAVMAATVEESDLCYMMRSGSDAKGLDPIPVMPILTPQFQANYTIYSIRTIAGSSDTHIWIHVYALGKHVKVTYLILRSSPQLDVC